MLLVQPRQRTIRIIFSKHTLCFSLSGHLMKEVSDERKVTVREQTRKRVAKYRANLSVRIREQTKIRDQTRKRMAKYRASMTEEKRIVCRETNSDSKFIKVVTDEDFLQIAIKKRQRISKWSSLRRDDEDAKKSERLRKLRVTMRDLKKTDNVLWEYKRNFNGTRLRRLSIFEDKRLPKMYNSLNGEVMARYRPDNTLKYTWVGEKTGVSIETRKPLDSWVPCESPYSVLTFKRNSKLVVGGLWNRK